jgi:hypothetical protein
MGGSGNELEIGERPFVRAGERDKTVSAPSSNNLCVCDLQSKELNQPGIVIMQSGELGAKQRCQALNNRQALRDQKEVKTLSGLKSRSVECFDLEEAYATHVFHSISILNSAKEKERQGSWQKPLIFRIAWMERQTNELRSIPKIIARHQRMP